jgi:hypothetical protein
MREITFQAEVKNGIIEIPKQYISQISPLVNVSVSDRKHYKKQAMEPDFKAAKIDTRLWKFNREEANER